jgi:uncharacterized surface protein with fasciclin (FAS1) repeats
MAHMEPDAVKRLFLKACTATVAAALIPACGGGASGGSTTGGSGGGGTGTLLQVVTQDVNFSVLRAAVEKAQLQSVLDNAGSSLTLFAPENSAFDALALRLGLGSGIGLIGALSMQQVRDILHFNVVPQRWSLADLFALATSGVRPATLYQYRGNAAALILMPQGGQLHIWGGIGRTVNAVRRADVAASNGVLHVISEWLLPRGVFSVAQTLLTSIDGFSEFGAEMTRNMITAELDGPGPFTLFAPVDGAVTPPLSAATWRNHVVSGLVLDSDGFLLPSSPATITLTMLSGRLLTLRRGSGSQLATLSDAMGVLANVTDVDFFANNGVTHTIDGMLVIR